VTDTLFHSSNERFPRLYGLVSTSRGSIAPWDIPLGLQLTFHCTNKIHTVDADEDLDFLGATAQKELSQVGEVHHDSLARKHE
jgi:hypothetical protein